MTSLMVLFLCCGWSLLAAEPAVDAKLAHHVPVQEITNLLVLAEEQFGKKVEALEYIEHDEPPVGEAVVIVRFSPEPESRHVYVFPAAFFHYLPWPKDVPLPTYKRKVLRGSWASDGTLQHTRKYRCDLSSKSIYLTFRPEIPYDEALALVKAIDADEYSVDMAAAVERRAREGHTPAPREFRGLRIETIFFVSADNASGEKRYIVHVQDLKGGLTSWTFVRRGSQYVLVAIDRYAI